jgi:hypothetical protein
MQAPTGGTDVRRADELRALYDALLEDPRRFDELANMLEQYELPYDEEEPLGARALRALINMRIARWLHDFRGLSARETMEWKLIAAHARVEAAAEND